MSATELEKTKATDPARTGADRPAWRRPHYDISESAEGFEVRVVMPGVNRSGVDISVDGEMLNITGTRTASVPKEWRRLRREAQEGNYRLNLRLNVPVNADKISATVEDGILRLTLPKADEVKPRKIKVK
ncbi:MAG: Hsp20/alpha crystallin family protein [Opitutales bacterium]